MTEAALARFTSCGNARWQTVTRIDAAKPRVSTLSDLWRDRYLLWIFTWRDMKVRYKQTLLGSAWAVLQPLLTMLVFTFVFSRLAKVPSGRIPYPVFVLSGLLPWQFFAYGLTRSSNSLVEGRHLLTKVFVPRLLLPVSAVLSGVPDLVLALAVLVGVMFYYRIVPSAGLVLAAPLIFVVALTSLSLGLFLSAIHVRYRDVGYVIPFFTQLLFFVTPVAYPVSLVPGRWQFFYALNPMSAMVETFRFAILGGPEIRPRTALGAAFIVGILFLGGLRYFQRMERNFADVV